METKVYNVSVRFNWHIDATSEEVAREMLKDQMKDWLEAVDSIAIEQASKDATITEV